MNGIDEIISIIGDKASDAIKEELKSLLSQAKSEQDEFARKTAQKMEKWLLLYKDGNIDKDELEALVDARRRTFLQHLNTLEIKARTRLEKTGLRLIDIILEYFLTKVI